MTEETRTDAAAEAPPEPASVADVRRFRDHPWIVSLPLSGMPVQIRRATLLELAATGRIPDDMGSAALVSLAEALDDAREQDPAQARRTLRKRVELINAVCIAMLVKPRMTAEGGDDALAPDDLPFDDRLHLYGIAVGTQEGPNLIPFPGGPRAGLAAGADGAGVGDQAVGAAGGS